MSKIFRSSQLESGACIRLWVQSQERSGSCESRSQNRNFSKPVTRLTELARSRSQDRDIKA
ncbi:MULTISPECIES: hypothetical protein [unclassified Microcoleus]|uniref:hypothetical protein n=1 Tax=unclassified Microcoleus TaxID=2642155 RepID=UPI002FCF9F31